ncbi:hypothetical protein ACROYT_G021293 [Oculina patagonica]
MHPAKPLLVTVIMGVLTALLTSASVIGNGFVLAIIARFKSLRTVPNILVANLALVDLLSAVINLPSYTTYNVLQASWFRGKTLAIMTSLFNRLFTILNLASMLAMMTNMYLAISFDLMYLGWKANKKALLCALLIWFISFVTVMLFSIPLLDIDLGDAHVVEYRKEIFKQAKQFVASIMAFFLIFGTVVCFLTIRAIKKKKNERAKLNLPPIQAEARLKHDIKATKTIAITIATYFLCYAPAILYAMVGLQEETLADSCFAFIAHYSLHISSAINPIIYYLRTSRCRSAFKQFMKDPFGSSDFKEKSNGRGNGEKRNDKVFMARKKNGERVESGETLKLERDGNQMRQKYSGKPTSDGMVILSIENLQADRHSHHKVGDGSGYGEETAEKGGEIRAPNLQVQNSCQGKAEETEEGKEVLPKQCGLKKESKNLQPSSSRNKIHPMGVTEVGKTGQRKGEKQKVNNHCSERKTGEVQELASEKG